MPLLYKEEHFTCYNYETSPDPIAEQKSFQEGEKWIFSNLHNKIIFLKEGEFLFSFGHHKGQKISKGQMLLIPAGEDVVVNVTKNTIVYNLAIRNPSNLCECFSLDMLLKEEDEELNGGNIYLLNVHANIRSFFDHWDIPMSDGLKCRYFLSLKIRELFYYLRAYHRKEDLLSFFYPILSNDLSFSDFVMRHKGKAKTVQELAELASYSLSGFQKRFKKVFGESAHAWMKRERLQAIFHDITNTDETFKEISDKFDFSSPSHFNDYCKVNLGYTPGVLRRKKIDIKIDK